MRRVRGVGRWGLILVLLLGGAVGVGVWLQFRPGLLTEEALSEARSRWEAEGPTSYLLEMELKGAVVDTRRIEVREGKVVAMTTGGAEVPASVWEYWSVTALFDSLATEMANAREPQKIFGGSGQAVVTLRVRFDPELGHPTYFLRHVSGSFVDMSWRVVSLQPL